MKCPQCEYQSPYDLVRCPQCHTAFWAAALEELAHLDYLQQRLEAWRSEGLLPAEVADRLLQAAAQTAAELNLGPSPAVALGDTDVATAPADVAASAATAPAEATPVGAEPVPLGRAASIPAAPADLVGAAAEPAPHVPGPIARDGQGEVVEAPQAPDAPGEHEPRAVPQPARPVFSWSQVGTYLLSERTLNTLLGLGAFLILASGVVISTLNPTRLPPLPHLGVVVATTAIFYAAGYVVRQRLRLAKTGAALLAIGAAFIPLDIWTLGQRSLLNWDAGAIWLAASLLCLPIYLASHALLRDRTFALLAALAGGSELLAVFHWLGVPPEWGFCALMGLALGYVALADRLRPTWEALAWALFWVAQAATPLVLIWLMVARFFPIVWQASLARPPGALFEYAIGGAWWLGVAFYALCARLFGQRRYRFLAAWTLPFAALFTLTKAPWDASWYNVCLALLAAGYLVYAWRRPAEAAPRFEHLLRRPSSQVGLGLTLVAAVWPFAHLESGIATLYTIAGTYAVAAYVFRLLALRYAAAYVLPVAVFLSLQKLGSLGLGWFQPAWHGLALAVLAIAYLHFGRLVLGAGRAAPAGFTYRNLALEPVYQVAALLTLVAADWPASGPESQATTLIAVSFTYALAAVLFGQRLWAYVSIYLLPVAYAVLVPALGLDGDPRALAWASLAAALLTAAELAARRAGEARRPLLETAAGFGPWRSRFASPLFGAGYMVGLAAVGVSLARYWEAPATAIARSLGWPAIVAFVVLVATAAVSAVTRRTSFFLYPATWLAPVPVTSAAALVFDRLGWPLPEHGVARILTVLGVAYLAAGLLLDRAGGHYAKPLYLAGYCLTLITMFLSVLDRPANVQVVGVGVLVCAGSTWLVHRGRHPSYLWLVGRLFRDPASATFRAGRALFVYLACWLFPVWLLLAMSLWRPLPKAADYGFAMALLAPAYAALGLWFRRIRPEYRMPWYSGAYVLSALGPLAATPDATLRTLALAVSIALYVVSARVARQSAWLYLVALLTPVLLWQTLAPFDVPGPVYGVGLVVSGLVYGCLGVPLHHGGLRGATRPISSPVGAFALPFFVVGYALSAVGLGIVAGEGGWTVVLGFGLASLCYAGSAFIFRQSVFGYPLATAAAVAYVVTMALTPLESRFYGLALLPGIGAALAVAEAARRRLDSRVWNGGAGAAPGWAGLRLDSWATPFYLGTYAGTVAVPAISWADPVTWALAWWSVAAVGGLSTALFRHPVWLYPTTVAGLVAYLATAFAVVPTLPLTGAMASLVALVWLLVGLAYANVRWRPVAARSTRWPLPGAGAVVAHPWAAPLYLLGLGTLVLSTVGSLPDARAGFWAAVAGAVLLAVTSLRSASALEVWGSLALAAVALQQGLRLLEVPLVDQPPRWAVAGLILTVLAFAVRPWHLARLAPWQRPLYLASLAVGAGAMMAALVVQVVLLSRAALQPLAATTAVTGLILVAHGFNRRQRLLGYAGVGLLLTGYTLQLLLFDVGQPQAFALPAGLYLLAVAYLEWRRGTGAGIKDALEGCGLALLLGVSLLQAVGFLGAGFERYVYDLFLFFESLALLGLGAALRWRKLFFSGSAALVVDTLVLLADPVRAMNTWYLAAGAGLAMIGLVVLVEQRRQQIPLWLDDWRRRLETWS